MARNYERERMRNRGACCSVTSLRHCGLEETFGETPPPSLVGVVRRRRRRRQGLVYAHCMIMWRRARRKPCGRVYVANAIPVHGRRPNRFSGNDPPPPHRAPHRRNRSRPSATVTDDKRHAHRWRYARQTAEIFVVRRTGSAVTRVAQNKIATPTYVTYVAVAILLSTGFYSESPPSPRAHGSTRFLRFSENPQLF